MTSINWYVIQNSLEKLIKSRCVVEKQWSKKKFTSQKCNEDAFSRFFLRVRHWSLGFFSFSNVVLVGNSNAVLVGKTRKMTQLWKTRLKVDFTTKGLSLEYISTSYDLFQNTKKVAVYHKKWLFCKHINWETWDGFWKDKKWDELRVLIDFKNLINIEKLFCCFFAKPKLKQ